jgi:PAS domain S-box-containing protein
MVDQAAATVLDVRAVLDSALEAFVTVDVEGLVTGWNPAAERTFGYRADEAIGRRIDELIIPESYRAAHRQGLAGVAAGGPGRLLGQRLELPACHRDGRTLYVELTLNPVATAQGRQFCGSAHDITERRRAERFRGCELAVAQALADAVDTGQAGRAVLQAVATTLDWPYAELWLTDPDQQTLSCVARWSPPGTDYQSLAANHLQPGVGAPGVAWQRGEPVWIPDLAADPDAGAARGAAAAAAGLHVTLALPIPGGTTPLGVLAFLGTAVADPQDVLIALLSGIAAHVGQYLQRRRAEELAVQLARAKEEFLALIVHELRNPLGVILAYGRMLLDDDDGGDQSDRRHLLGAIDRNAVNLSTIVNDLLDLARLESGQFSMRMTATDLCAPVRDAAETARAPPRPANTSPSP